MRALRGIVVITLLLWLAALAPAATARAWLTPGVVAEHGTLDPASVQVAADGQGTLTAVWIGGEQIGEERVWMATRPATSAVFGTPVPLSEAGHLSEARLAVNRAGAAVVVWQRSDGPQMRRLVGVTRSSADGRFTEPADVSAEGLSARSAVVVDEAGLATVLVNLVEPGPQYRVWATSVAAGTADWAEPSPLSEVASADVAAAVDGAGRVTAIWVAPGEGSIGRVVQTSDRAPGDGWSPAQSLTDGEEYREYPVAAANAAGETVVAWVSDVPRATRVMVARRPAGAADFSAALPAGRLVEAAVDLDAALDSDGTATLVWNATSGDADQLWATRVTAAGATTNEVISRVPWDDDADFPDVAVDAAGAVTVAWTAGTTAGGDLLTAYRPPAGTFQRAVRTAHADERVRQPQVVADPSGDVTVLYSAWDGSGEPDTVASVVLDGSAPALGSVVAPATAAIGAAVSMQARATDRFSGPPSIAWDFGDGARATGASVTHAWTTAGTYVVTVTATDGAGNTATTTRSVTVPAAADTTAPLVSGARLKPARLPAGKAARLKVTVSESAELVGKVSHKLDGRWRKAGSKKQWAVETGSSTLKVYGKGAQRRLEPGRYRIELTATDAAGNASKTVTARFTVAE